MGAYLSEPITEKISTDEANDIIKCGVSSMQGWRMSQEDAHNCILDFETNASLFAVYDGHGGAEVALYCAQKLPNFLRNTDDYKNGNYEQALKDTFIGFDATLTQDKVHAELKSLIPVDKPDRESETEEDAEDGDDDIEDLAELCQESRMPLNELLEKYKDGKKNVLLNKVKKDDVLTATSSGNNKPISPYLRGRRFRTDPNDGSGSSGLCISKTSYSISSEASPSASLNIRRKVKCDDAENEQVSSSSASSSSTSEATIVGKSAEQKPATSNNIDQNTELAGSSCTGNEASAESASGNNSSSSSSNSSNNNKSNKTSSSSVGDDGAENSNYISPDSSSTKNKKPTTASAESSSCNSSSEAKQLEPKSIMLSTTNTTVNGETENCMPDDNKSQENEITTNSLKTDGSVSSSSSSSSSQLSSATNAAVGSSNTSMTILKTDTVAIAENGEVSSNSILHADKPVSTNDSKTKINVPTQLRYDTSSDEDEEDATYNEDKSSTEDGEGCEIESEEDTENDDVDDDEEDEDNDDQDDDEDDDDDDDEDEDNEDDDIFPDQDIDESFLNDMVEGPGSSSGCTAVVALLIGRDLYVANAGDSRCVVCRNGEALEMSIDHKPEDDLELERIRKAGGDVSMDGRVNGGLNLSRAIGDHAYKQNKTLGPEEQMISAMPDVKKITIADGDEFMIIACDGIWNFMSSDEVVQFIKPKLAEKREKLSTICEELFTNCLANDTLGDGTGCDNMTAVLIQFKPTLLQNKSIEMSNNNGNMLTASGNSVTLANDESDKIVTQCKISPMAQQRKRFASTSSAATEISGNKDDSKQIEIDTPNSKRLKKTNATEQEEHSILTDLPLSVAEKKDISMEEGIEKNAEKQQVPMITDNNAT